MIFPKNGPRKLLTIGAAMTLVVSQSGSTSSFTIPYRKKSSLSIKQIYRFNRDINHVESLQFHPDGSLIVFGNARDEAKPYRIITLKYANASAGDPKTLALVGRDDRWDLPPNVHVMGDGRLIIGESEAGNLSIMDMNGMILSAFKYMSGRRIWKITAVNRDVVLVADSARNDAGITRLTVMSLKTGEILGAIEEEIQRNWSICRSKYGNRELYWIGNSDLMIGSGCRIRHLRSPVGVLPSSLTLLDVKEKDYFAISVLDEDTQYAVHASRSGRLLSKNSLQIALPKGMRLYEGSEGQFVVCMTPNGRLMMALEDEKGVILAECALPHTTPIRSKRTIIR